MDTPGLLPQRVFQTEHEARGSSPPVAAWAGCWHWGQPGDPAGLQGGHWEEMGFVSRDQPQLSCHETLKHG